MRTPPKTRFRNFLKWNVADPVRDRLEELSNEILFQKIFDQQCHLSGIVNDFFPVGAAANYSLLYLISRLLKEHAINSIVELGSGETTRLIDALRGSSSSHICYEHDPIWYERVRERLGRCDYRLRALEERVIDGHPCSTYANVDPASFDLLLVDGPIGIESFSRFGCVELALANPSREFLVVLDDCDRPGEQQTAAYLSDRLRQAGRPVAYRVLRGKKAQGVFATPGFSSVLCYW